MGYKNIRTLGIILLLLCCMGCSSGGGDSPPPNKGTAVITLVWQNGTTTGSQTIDRSVAYDTTQCANIGIETIISRFYDENDTYLTEGSATCDQQEIKVENIPGGTNRKLIVSGYDAASQEIYHGEKTGIEILAGQVNQIGEVVMDKVLIDTYTDPVATILTPSSGSSFLQGESITFTGSGTDVEDGTLSGDSLVWMSDLDGLIGQGGSFVRNDLTTGTHKISLTVTDSDQSTNTATVTIQVTPTYTITASAGQGGSISPTGIKTLTGGESQAYTISPDQGYVISEVTVDDQSQGDVDTYTFDNVTANHTISVEFALITYNINVLPEQGATFSPSGDINLNYGENQTITVDIDSAYEFVALYVDGVSQGKIKSYTFSNVTADHTITAVCNLLPVTSGDYINSVGMAFKLIQKGSFRMGSALVEIKRYEDEEPHQVTLTKSYYMQTTEVTQAQWRDIMGTNPAYFKTCGDNCPVEQVSWNDAQNFITELNKRGEGSYRLPTEAEWENASRAGSIWAFPNGSMTESQCGLDPNLSVMGWYCGNSDNTTHPVAQKTPNSWGLYDMQGNVYEWCQDWYGPYQTPEATDPTGPDTGTYRIRRGGAWYFYALFSRCAYRGNYYPEGKNIFTGFRVVRDVDASSP